MTNRSSSYFRSDLEPLDWYAWHWQRARADRRWQRLSWQARGALREIFDEIWAHGGVPDDDAALAEIVGCTRREIAEMRPQLMTLLFEIEPRILSNRRLESIRSVKDRERVDRARAGSMGGVAATKGRKHNEQGDLLAGAEQVPVRREEKRREEERRDEIHGASEFDEAWALYPKRDGGNPKKSALKAWDARIRSQVTPADRKAIAEQMLAGVVRYAVYCEAKGKIGTEFVMQAATFFGPSLRFMEPYAIGSSNGNGSGRVARVDAALRDWEKRGGGEVAHG